MDDNGTAIPLLALKCLKVTVMVSYNDGVANTLSMEFKEKNNASGHIIAICCKFTTKW